jgi:probable HAF family extracellular repeat protein
MSITLTLPLALLMVARMAAQQQQQRIELPRYTVIDLGTLGGTLSWAEGINEKGWVAGFSSLSGDASQHGFLWRDGVTVDLGTLGGPSSGLGFWGQKPNERGQMAGMAQTPTPDALGEDFCGFFNNFASEPPAPNECLPFVWQNGLMTPLSTLGGNNGGASQINNRGQVVGAAEKNGLPDPACGTPPAPHGKPVLWENGVVQELPALPGDPYAFPNAINDLGQVVGVSVNSCIPTANHAVLWENAKVTYLGSLGGTVNDEATDINNQSQVVGFSSLPGDATFHGFFWQNGVMKDLGTLAGDFASLAIGINSKAQVVGASFDASFNPRAFVGQNGVMVDLNSLIPAGSSLFLLFASRINSSGQIVGLAFDTSTNESHAFLASPDRSAAAAQEETRQRPIPMESTANSRTSAR